MDRNNPTKKNQDLVFGTRAIMEAIRAGKEIDKLFLQKGLSNELIKELSQLAISYGIPFTKVPVEKLNRLTRKTHQGAVCFLSSIHYASLDNIIGETYNKGKVPLVLILDRVTDVRNFGAISRTAECAQVDAIVIPTRGGAAINSDAMKTSAGALNFIPVCREANLKKTIQYLKDSGLQVIACTEKTEEILYSSDFTAPTAILMGSEEDGISPEYLKLCDRRAKIPIYGKIESLNVSVSAAVILYEALRQRSS